MLVKIEPEQISNVVSRELQQLYADIKTEFNWIIAIPTEDKDFVVNAGFDLSQQELMRALTTLIEYYTPPSEFDVWKEHDA